MVLFNAATDDNQSRYVHQQLKSGRYQKKKHNNLILKQQQPIYIGGQAASMEFHYPFNVYTISDWLQQSPDQSIASGYLGANP